MTTPVGISEDRNFSLSGYTSILDSATREGYRFITFRQLDHVRSSVERLFLMRHDVDVNVNFALTLAQLEAERRVTTTYFLMLRSPAYNLLGRAATLAVREIAALGHEVAIHFDAQHPTIRGQDPRQAILSEAAIVADLVGQPITAVSFHQPTAELIASNVEIPGLINTYNSRQMAGWHYISDSNRKWRGAPLWNQIRDGIHRRLHVLTHPLWWVCGAPTTQEVWDSALQDNFDTAQQQFLETEAAYGPRRRVHLLPAGSEVA